ncbi:MAG: molybdopterin-guanine dinucleotide biosynthesis protein B [Thermodesulfobacteriota bacterium]
MVPAISIVGFSGSGKTTLIVKVVSELTARGFRVGTIKHDAHKFEIDREGKDSWRHKKAGAVSVLLTSADKLAFIKSTDAEMPLPEAIEHFMAGLDVVITEGYKTGNLPKIEVYRSSVSEQPACLNDPGLLAVVSDGPVETGKPLLDINDFMGVCDIIEDKIIRAAESGAEKKSSADIEFSVEGLEAELSEESALRLRSAVIEALQDTGACGALAEDAVVELKLGKR